MTIPDTSGTVPGRGERRLTNDELEALVFSAHWPEGVSQRKAYRIYCDDKGRDGGVWLQVHVAVDGDVHVAMMDWEEVKEDPESKPNPFPSLRVRTHGGGGRNWRTRQALLWLARAMQLDAAENPEDPYRADRAQEQTR